jgi:heterotetrameric sarcosine oxidase delta subunit
MLRLHCPHCGLRDETEFRYGGEAGRVRPAGRTAAEWSRYLYWRRNPVGVHTELWLHASGCRRWLKLERDTLTNSIMSVCDANTVAGGEPTS